MEVDASEIGANARMIRHRRGLSLDVVAGFVGISKQYLSALERGRRGFNRRGLIEDLAEALGCSVADLTGQPYLAVDRGSADALAVIAEITPLLYDISLDHVRPAARSPMTWPRPWPRRRTWRCSPPGCATVTGPFGRTPNPLKRTRPRPSTCYPC